MALSRVIYCDSSRVDSFDKNPDSESSRVTIVSQRDWSLVESPKIVSRVTDSSPAITVSRTRRYISCIKIGLYSCK